MSKDILVTLIGSFRKDTAGLQALFEELTSKYTVLSPTSIDWEDTEAEFVKTGTDRDKTVKDIESRHLEAIRSSDFVIVFAPEGYVGLSGSLEIGFAYALGVPVVATEPIKDQTIAVMVDGLYADDIPLIDYGRGLKALQTQYAKIAKRNDWDSESARDTMLLLTEEIGELARAVRKHEGLQRDGAFDVQLSEEIADVQIYLAHLANATNIDLGDAVTHKILKNQQKRA